MREKVKKIESEFYFINLKLKEIYMKEKKKHKSNRDLHKCEREKNYLFNKFKNKNNKNIIIKLIIY